MLLVIEKQFTWVNGYLVPAKDVEGALPLKIMNADLKRMGNELGNIVKANTCEK